MLISRRSFLLSAGSGLFLSRRITLCQTPIERGRFDNDSVPLAREKLLQLVNDERAFAGLSPVEMDDLACKVASDHALDMANRAFLSHWGSDGLKPYHRYSFAGGIDAVQENVSQANHIASVTPYGVQSDLNDMHLKMVNEAPPNDGHRRTILAPQHTHVGFGVALHEHNVSLVEMFVARYVKLDSIRPSPKRDSTIFISGRPINPKHFLHQVEVFYEPLPEPLDITWLRTPRPYSLPDLSIALRPKAPQGTLYTDGSKGDYDWTADGRFRVPVLPFENKPGIYTVIFWLRKAPADKAFPAAGICLRSITGEHFQL